MEDNNICFYFPIYNGTIKEKDVNKAWDKSKRPSQAPRHRKLDQLYETWDLEIGVFAVWTSRAGARDLRKEMFCSAKGVRNVPKGAGTLVLPHPTGWTLLLEYEKPNRRCASWVLARFMPPDPAANEDEDLVGDDVERPQNRGTQQ